MMMIMMMVTMVFGMMMMTRKVMMTKTIMPNEIKTKMTSAKIGTRKTKKIPHTGDQ